MYRNSADEEEIFDSDFASTDEEEAQEDIEEKAVQEEEKREHRVSLAKLSVLCSNVHCSQRLKTVRQRVAKAVEAASQRHRAAFNIPAQSQPTEAKPRLTGRGRRRVSLGVAIDVETGEVVDAAKALKNFAKDNKALVIKGGVMDGSPLSATELDKIADLESREVLLAKMAGALKGNQTKAAGLFNAPASQLARLFAALEDKKN